MKKMTDFQRLAFNKLIDSEDIKEMNTLITSFELYNVELTRSQAIVLADKGLKLTHANFLAEEWFTTENGIILFEDNTTVSKSLFWYDRNNITWDKGYNLFKN